MFRSSLARIAPVSRAALPRAMIRSPHIRTLVTKKYTEDHESVTYDDSTGLGTVRITDHAQQALGDIVFVEIFSVGTEVAQGEQLGAVESVKAASDIYAPVSGKIIEINERLASEPGLLNKSAEDEGWLCKIELSDAKTQLDDLMDLEAYQATIQGA